MNKKVSLKIIISRHLDGFDRLPSELRNEIRDSIAAYALNVNSVLTTRREIRDAFADFGIKISTGTPKDLCISIREDIDLFYWKLAAVQYAMGKDRAFLIYGEKSDQFREEFIGICKRKGISRDTIVGMVHREKPSVADFDREVSDIVKKLYRRSLARVNRKMSFLKNAWSKSNEDFASDLLVEVIPLVRWHYPFSYNMGGLFWRRFVGHMDNMLNRLTNAKHSLIIEDEVSHQPINASLDFMMDQKTLPVSSIIVEESPWDNENEEVQEIAQAVSCVEVPVDLAEFLYKETGQHDLDACYEVLGRANYLAILSRYFGKTIEELLSTVNTLVDTEKISKVGMPVRPIKY